MLGPTTSPDAVKQPVRLLPEQRVLPGQRCCLLLWNGWRLLGFGPGIRVFFDGGIIAGGLVFVRYFFKFDEEEALLEENEDGQNDENDAHDAGTTVVAAGDGDSKLSVLGLSGKLEDLTVHFEDDLRRALNAAELASGELHAP